MFLASGQWGGRRNQSDGQFRNSFTLLLNTGMKTERSVTQSVSFYSPVNPSVLFTFPLKTETNSVSASL